MSVSEVSRKAVCARGGDSVDTSRQYEGMVAVTFIAEDGTERTLAGEIGMSVMEVAVRGGVDAIVAECGGARACATCHVHVEPEWLARTGAAQGDEADMLEFTREPGPDSRLSCQIRLTAALDGLRVRPADNRR
jgi:2Fe-2S ferredoxin